MKRVKQVPTIWKKLETIMAARFQHDPVKNSRELTTTCFAGILSASGQEGNNFSIYCGIGEFLLDFRKYIIIANVCSSLHRLLPLLRCDARRKDGRTSAPASWPRRDEVHSLLPWYQLSEREIGIRFLVEAIDFSVLHIVQIGSGV